MKRYWLVRIEERRGAEKRRAEIILSMAAPQPPEDFCFSDMMCHVFGLWYDDEQISAMMGDDKFVLPLSMETRFSSPENMEG
jgi:hypothetical protein